MYKKKFSTQELTMIGMLTAVLSVLSILQIPMPSGVPLTLQTFAVALCGYVLGCRKGMFCIVLYLLTGFIGLPVFTGMTAGIGKLFGFTGGFLYGFLVLAGLCGAGIRCRKGIESISMGVSGLLICHLLGAAHYSIVASCGLVQAFLLVSLPYLVKDVLSVIGAYLVSVAVRKSCARAGVVL